MKNHSPIFTKSSVSISSPPFFPAILRSPHITSSIVCNISWKMECNINNSGSRDKEVTIDIENDSRLGLVPNIEKDNKTAGKIKKAPKPPRPPRSPSLDSSDMRLIKEISKIAVEKRERIYRIKALKKMKVGRLPLSSSSSSSSLTSSGSTISAMVITVLFFLVLIIQGLGCITSSNMRLRVAPQPAPESRGLTADHFYKSVQ